MTAAAAWLLQVLACVGAGASALHAVRVLSELEDDQKLAWSFILRSRPVGWLFCWRSVCPVSIGSEYFGGLELAAPRH